VSSWDGGAGTGWFPLLSGGVEISLGSAVFAGYLSGVLRDNGFDLTADLFAGYLWKLGKID
jgi:hypothetical protein